MLFIDDVYAPFIIHHVLEIELNKHKRGESSIYGIIENAGEKGGKDETEEAFECYVGISRGSKSTDKCEKNELLSPILQQEREVLSNRPILSKYDICQYNSNCLSCISS